MPSESFGTMRRDFERKISLETAAKLPEEKGKGVRIWRDGRQRHWAW